jgi:hypothetical protein
MIYYVHAASIRTAHAKGKHQTSTLVLPLDRYLAASKHRLEPPYNSINGDGDPDLRRT